MEDRLAYSSTEQVNSLAANKTGLARPSHFIPKTAFIFLCILPNLCVIGTCVICGQDMVLLHHEVEVEFPDGLREKHSGTLLEFGQTKNGKMITAMAFTVGIPAAIGALVLTIYVSVLLHHEVR